MATSVRLEDAHEWLVFVAVQTAQRYDARKSKPGYKFESYIWDVCERRMIDWFRWELGDSRFAHLAEARKAFKLPLSIDAIREHEPEARSLATEDEHFGSDMAVALSELGAPLSPEARSTLQHIARPLAEGYGQQEVARQLHIQSQPAARASA